MRKTYRKPTSTILFWEPECLLSSSIGNSTLHPGSENTVVPNEKDYNGDFQTRHKGIWNND